MDQFSSHKTYHYPEEPFIFLDDKKNFLNPNLKKSNIKKMQDSQSHVAPVGPSQSSFSLIKWAMKMLSYIVRVTTYKYLITTRNNNNYIVSSIYIKLAFLSP